MPSSLLLLLHPSSLLLLLHRPPLLRREIGTFKSKVSVVECRLFYRALLQKRRIIWRRLLMVATHSTKRRGNTAILDCYGCYVVFCDFFYRENFPKVNYIVILQICQVASWLFAVAEGLARRRYEVSAQLPAATSAGMISQKSPVSLFKKYFSHSVAHCMLKC